MISNKSITTLILTITLSAMMISYYIAFESSVNAPLHNAPQSIAHLKIPTVILLDNENIEEDLKAYKYLCVAEYELDYHNVTARNTLRQMFSKANNVSFSTFSRPPPVA